MYSVVLSGSKYSIHYPDYDLTDSDDKAELGFLFQAHHVRTAFYIKFPDLPVLRVQGYIAYEIEELRKPGKNSIPGKIKPFYPTK